jgi:anthranilate synthase/phosphoribosyltransferase
MIDNFDSFTYNIVQYLEILGLPVTTVRNNKITLTEIEKIKPTHIVISPGPGTPAEAGISIDIIRRFAGKIPILGICLGHQAIIEAFGGKVIRAARVVHGKKEPILHDERGLFRNIPVNFQAVRYHSLAGERTTLPECLEITATSAVDNEIMGIRHNKLQIEGLQFHPESIGTEHGMLLLKNFFSYKRNIPQKITLMKKLSDHQALTTPEAYTLMDEITSGELSESQLGFSLGAINTRGVTADELYGFASVLRDKAGITKTAKGLLDTCGTGGDGKHTFNISTAAALVCAAAGVPVAKHGNRAITSQSGSFDFLNALGFATNNTPEQALANIKINKFAFLFAPLYHSAMKHVAKVRQELKIRTVFNMLGPLSNPLRADYQIIGVFSPELLDLFIQTLKKLGLRRAMVVHGNDGIDEISISTATKVRELTATGKIKAYTIAPKEFGLQKYSLNDIKGGTAAENAKIFQEIIAQQLPTKQHKAIRDAVALNAGAALYITGKATSIKSGYKRALSLISDGSVAEYLHRSLSLSK